MAAFSDVEKQVRRVDEDRWLATRFAPPALRSRLCAIYALNHELSRIGGLVREPSLGHLRLAWWREALSEMGSRPGVRAHPVLNALASAHQQAPLPSVLVERMIAARWGDIGRESFSSCEELEEYFESTAGVVIRLALASAGAGGALPSCFVECAGRAWGYVDLVRSEPIWRSRGHRRYPQDDRGKVLERGVLAYREARALASQLNATFFPAFGYVALTPMYLDRRTPGVPSLFGRQLRLLFASATGRL